MLILHLIETWEWNNTLIITVYLIITILYSLFFSHVVIFAFLMKNKRILPCSRHVVSGHVADFHWFLPTPGPTHPPNPPAIGCLCPDIDAWTLYVRGIEEAPEKRLTSKRKGIEEAPEKQRLTSTRKIQLPTLWSTVKLLKLLISLSNLHLESKQSRERERLGQGQKRHFGKMLGLKSPAN